MAQDFQVRRDTSANNVPVVAYNEGSDLQDVVLFGAFKTTENLTTNASSQVTTANPIISVSGRVTTDTDANAYRRGRDYRYDITAVTPAGVTYYPGEVDAYNGTITLYSNPQLSVRAPSNTAVNITYYSRRNIEVDENGRFTYAIDLTGWEVVNNIDIQSATKKPAVWRTNNIQLPTGSIAGNVRDMTYYEGNGIYVDQYVTKIIFPQVTGNVNLSRQFMAIVDRTSTTTDYTTIRDNAFFFIERYGFGAAVTYSVPGYPMNEIDLGDTGIRINMNNQKIIYGVAGANSSGNVQTIGKAYCFGYWLDTGEGGAG